MVVLGDHVHYEDGSLGDVVAGLDRLEFLVVSDAFMSAAADRANVVFPAEVWAEKTGTYTNIERRVQPLRKVLKNKRAESRSDLDVIAGIAKAMGAQGFDYEGPEQVLAEIGQAIPEYAGISYQRLLRERIEVVKPPDNEPQPTQVMYTGNVLSGIQWPCSDREDAGTPVLYADGFRHGKAMLQPVAWHPRPARESRFPLMLAHGRVLVQPGRKPDVVVEGKRNRLQQEAEFILNPADAAAAGLGDGQAAILTTDAGSQKQGRVMLADAVPEGVVSLTTLFGELAVETDASDRPDPMNHIPRLNAAPARIEPA